MSAFTCITCRVKFVDADLQRKHYQSEWHRYNLKRKIAHFPPVSIDDYSEILLKQQEKEDKTAASNARECTACHKTFTTDNSFKNHANSKKHKHMVLKQNNAAAAASNNSAIALDTIAPIADEYINSDNEVEEWKDDEIGEEECLFCPLVSDDLTSNMHHMTQDHGFFIPDIEYLVDLEGLMRCLGEKIAKGRMCLWCNFNSKLFYSRDAVQKHMQDKDHIKMYFEGRALLEYSEYYDYSDCPVAHKRCLTLGENATADDFPDKGSLDDTGFALTLPSGNTIGHRSLQKYFKQKLNPEKERTISDTARMLTRTYKQLGWTGVSGPAAIAHARDIRYADRLRKDHYLRVSVKANKLQHHYREQNPI